ARRKKKMHSMFSPLLIDTVTQALKNREQVILFQNRRGFSPYLECELCGWVPQCEHCDVSLTYHKHSHSLVCHYCGYTIRNISHCNACGNPGMQTRGFGTEKIEDEAAIFFPGAKIARMDLDTTRKKRAYETLIGDFEDHKIDILIGTQMLTKGLDFNNVSVVGILNADNMLHYPDFRAFERSFQLMTQVSGRSGRANKRGTVIIQTGDPQHEIIQQVLENNFKGMYLAQVNDRKNFRYPPFYRMVRITLKHKKKDVLSRGAGELGDALRKKFADRVIGPEYPPIARIQQYYLKSIILKVERERSFAKAREMLRATMDQLVIKPEYKAMQFVVDVDPV
ncbi:MAG: replication restart helicase PriA, partial [Bacteroidota bacterium]